MWYAVTRCAVLLMSPENIKGKLICVTVDAIIYVVLNIVVEKTAHMAVSNAAGKQADSVASGAVMQYIFWPGTIIATASGSIKRAAYILAAEILIVGYVYIVRSALIRIKNRTNNRTKNGAENTTGNKEAACNVRYDNIPYGLYGLSGMAVLVFFFARDIYGQYIGMLADNSGNVPMLLVLSILLMIAAPVSVLIGMSGKASKMSQAHRQSSCDCFSDRGFPGFKCIDALIMITGTIAFFIIGIIGLGTHTIPSSQLHIQADRNRDVVLDFGREVKISRVEIFLGYEGKRTVSFSKLEDEGWNVFKSRQEITSAYCWNEIKLDSTQQVIGCVFLDNDAYVGEMVFFDDNGNKILPQNAGAYMELFDEQALYPEDETYYYRTMFDEVYHARTAYEFANDLPIYENTHPPLGKTIISLGIKMFGMNPFGWRFMSVVCGSFIVTLVYAFALRITGSRECAVFAMLLQMTEFMHFTLSRIATIDIIAAVFIIAMFYFMAAFIQTEKRVYLVLDGIVSGAAIAVKWTGIYAGAGLALIFLMWCMNKRRDLLSNTGILDNKVSKMHKDCSQNAYWLKLGAECVGCFIVVPLVIYTLSYIQFAQVYTDKNAIQHVISNGKLMLSYHSKTIFEHPYASEWYEWIFDKKSLLDALTVNTDGSISSVATFAGPVVCWGGIVAFFHQVYRWSVRKDRISAMLVIAYASLIIPWMFVKRTVFIYHYLTCLSILVLMIAYSVRAGIVDDSKRKKVMIVTAIISIALFAMFYPVLSGADVPREYINVALKWLQGWRFV